MALDGDKPVTWEMQLYLNLFLDRGSKKTSVSSWLKLVMRTYSGSPSASLVKGEYLVLDLRKLNHRKVVGVVDPQALHDFRLEKLIVINQVADV